MDKITKCTLKKNKDQEHSQGPHRGDNTGHDTIIWFENDVKFTGSSWKK